MVSLRGAAEGLTAGFNIGFKISQARKFEELQKRRLENQERQQRIQNALTMFKVVGDKDATPEMKQFVADAILKDVGVDKKTEFGKNVTAMIKSSDERNKVLVRKMLGFLPFASKEQKRQLAELAGTNPGQALTLMQQMIAKGAGPRNVAPGTSVVVPDTKGGVREVFRAPPAAAPTTNVNVIGAKGETAFAKTRGKEAAERIEGVIDEGEKAGRLRGQISAARVLANEPDFATGPVARIRSAIAGLATEAGLPEAAKAIANAPTLQVLDSSLSAVTFAQAGKKLGVGFSNADRTFVQNITGQISNVKDAIKAKLFVLDKIAQRDQARATLASDPRFDSRAAQPAFQAALRKLDSTPILSKDDKKTLRGFLKSGRRGAVKVPKTIQDAAKRLGAKRVIGPAPGGFLVEMPDGTQRLLRRKRP